MSQENKTYCKKHKEQKESQAIGNGMFVYSCKSCRVDNERGSESQDALKIKREEQEWAAKAKKRLDAAKIPARFKDASIDNFETSSGEQKTARSQVVSFLAAAPNKTGMIFLGPCGTGKTHLAVATLKHCIGLGRSGLFIEAIKIFRAVKESWKHAGTRESDVLKQFIEPFLLIIDEVGVQYDSDAEQMFLTEIVNDRYNALKPTVLLGNLAKSKMEAVIGERAFGRITENCPIVILDGKDYRKRGKNV